MGLKDKRPVSHTNYSRKPWAYLCNFKIAPTRLDSMGYSAQEPRLRQGYVLRLAQIWCGWNHCSSTCHITQAAERECRPTHEVSAPVPSLRCANVPFHFFNACWIRWYHLQTKSVEIRVRDATEVHKWSTGERWKRIKTESKSLEDSGGVGEGSHTSTKCQAHVLWHLS